MQSWLKKVLNCCSHQWGHKKVTLQLFNPPACRMQWQYRKIDLKSTNHHPIPFVTCMTKLFVHFCLVSLGWGEPLHHFWQGCDLKIFTNKIEKSRKKTDIIAYFWYAITPRSKGTRVELHNVIEPLNDAVRSGVICGNIGVVGMDV